MCGPHIDTLNGKARNYKRAGAEISLRRRPGRYWGSRICRGGTIVVAAHHVDSETCRERNADRNDQARVAFFVKRGSIRAVVVRGHLPPPCKSSRDNGARDP